MFTQFFFLAGLAAVAFFFSGIVLLGMSLFAETPAVRRRLTRVQSAALFLLLALTVWSCWRLRERLLPWIGGAPPTTASALMSAMREIMTGTLLGLSLVVNALLAAFAWVRIARPGNALRALMWALPGLQLVLGCQDLLNALQEPESAGFVEAYSELVRTLHVTTGIALGVWLVSWPAGWMLRRPKKS